MKLNPKTLVLSLAVTLGAAASPLALASDSALGEVKEAAKDVKKGVEKGAEKNVKKAARAASDKACADGTAKCTLKKGKHKLENAGDELAD